MATKQQETELHEPLEHTGFEDRRGGTGAAIHGKFGGVKGDFGDALHKFLHRAGVSEKTRELAVREARTHQASGRPLPAGEPRRELPSDLKAVMDQLSARGHDVRQGAGLRGDPSEEN